MKPDCSLYLNRDCNHEVVAFKAEHAHCYCYSRHLCTPATHKQPISHNGLSGAWKVLIKSVLVSTAPAKFTRQHPALTMSRLPEDSSIILKALSLFAGSCPFQQGRRDETPQHNWMTQLNWPEPKPSQSSVKTEMGGKEWRKMGHRRLAVGWHC